MTAPFTYRSQLVDVAGDRRRPLTFGRRDAHAIEAELYSYLTPAKRRIWIQRSLLILVRAALLIAVAEMIAAFLRFSAVDVPASVVNAVNGFVGAWALILILRQRVTFADAARVLDRRLGLQQTIGTAVELASSGTDSRLSRLQLRGATDMARQVESGQVVPLRLPGRELRAIAVVVIATVAFTYLSTLNLAWPGTPPEETISIDPGVDLEPAVPYVSDTFDSEGVPMDPELFADQFGDLRTELETQNLSAEEITARLAEVQAMLAQRAEAQNRLRQSLSDLADTLSDNSTTSDTAESIRRGEYQRAASQLSELGKQSGQLSQRARRDLAQRLEAGANRVERNNPDLAQRMRRAAQALANQDQQGQQASEQALAELGQGVDQAGQQMDALSDTSQAIDPSLLGEGAMAGEGGVPSDIEAEAQMMQGGQGAAAGADGESGYGEGEGEGLGEGFGELSDAELAALASSSREREVGGNQGGSGDGAGVGPGRETYSAPNRQALTQGRILELRGRPTSSGTSSVEEGDNVPLVSSNDGTVGGAAGSGSSRTVIVDPLSVRAEQNFVPWEKRPIIKDYFAGTTR